MKVLFKIIGMLGFVIICICAFAIPDNPYEMIPSYSLWGFDKPLSSCIIFGGGFTYGMLCLYIYNRKYNLKE